MHRRFHIGPHKVSLNLLLPEFHRQEILLTIAIMKEKQQHNLFEIKCLIAHTYLDLDLDLAPETKSI